MTNKIEIAPIGRAKGTYILILSLPQHKTIAVGRLGVNVFRRGHYAYVGSALGSGGLAARIGRHLRSDVKPHWHIDALRREASVCGVWFARSERRYEHQWAQVLAQSGGDAIPGFGCSDCGCSAHLFHFDSLPDRRRFSLLWRRRKTGTAPNPRLYGLSCDVAARH